ncbi:MAG: GntR family transcriptional regulator [Candidatus Omnitrophica bacterium]|nr:GntR family transcriptional regulator [Candidatus Omnitrophota bacterium]
MDAKPTKTKFHFQISASSGVPIYRQIMDQIKIQIATQPWDPEQFLPSVRQIAEDLAINPMTVSKAYSLLEKEGVLEFDRGKGMRVKKISSSQKNFGERQKDVTPLLKEVIVKAHQLALKREDIFSLLEKLWREHPHEK